MTEPARVEIEDTDAAANGDEITAAVQRSQIHHHRPKALLYLDQHRTTVQTGDIKDIWVSPIQNVSHMESMKSYLILP